MHLFTKLAAQDSSWNRHRVLILLLITFTQQFQTINTHGRLHEPPGRSTLWRLTEFQSLGLDPPLLENYDDDQLYCGGIGKLLANDGKCGPCGDAWDLRKPRDNENGGLYGRGVIARNYSVGQTISIGVELTANHWGYFEFRLCPLQKHHGDKIPEDDNCFDKYLLQLGDGSKDTRYNITIDKPGWFNTSVLLPPNVWGRAVLQWHYKAGNIWNPCDDLKSDNEITPAEVVGSTSCGHQEIFRGCSDIFIGDDYLEDKIPSSSSSKPFVKPKPIEMSTKPPGVQLGSSTGGNKNKATIPPMRPPKFEHK